nr:Aminotransferase domain containing protein [Haemonchus contortus]
MQSFYHSELQVIKQEKPKSLPKNREPLGFGLLFSDHMLEVDWSSDDGWTKPKILPYENFSLDPACKVFHYATELFEGMKAYRGDDGRIRLFRPHLNMDRMRQSAKRAALPDFDGEQLLECIKDLVRVDQAWVPEEKGAALYIRPTLIGTEPSLAVSNSKRAKLFVITSPVGAYFTNGFAPIKLLADAKFARAARGGVGAFKMGSNYGPTMSVAAESVSEGCQQVLWLSGKEHYVTEAGAMNVFLHWKNERGENELITPSLDSGLILPGITRLSILQLARDLGNVKVTERDFTMNELKNAVKENRAYEFFGSGTAVVLSPIDSILYKADGRNEDIRFPKIDITKSLMAKLFNTITDIQYGRKSRPGWTVEI